MGWGKRFIGRLFAAEIERQVGERLPAAVGQELSMIGWRKLTGAPTRELPMMDQNRAIEVAYWLWKTNPLAKWIIEVTTAFVAAKGMPVSCRNLEVGQVLRDFWDDPVNRLDIHWENFVRELGIYGEQCWPAFVAEQTGRVRLAYVDPAWIQEVFADPENVKIKIGLTVGSPDGGGHPKRYRIVLNEENQRFLSPAAEALRETFGDGECFFFTVNALTNEMRGTSDLFTVADHLDHYEQFIFDHGEKWARFNAFFWDVTVQGADKKNLEAERAAYTPPRSGSAFIHNEKVKAQAVSPDMKPDDSQSAGRILRNHVLGASGLPEHWYGGGGDINRATAAEMDGPAKKIIANRQEKIKNMLEMIFDYVLWHAADSRYLNVPDDELYAYEVQTPEVDEKDVAKLSTMLQQVSAALTAAETQGWIDKAEAAKAFAYFLAFIGYEYDPEATDLAPEYADYRGKGRSDRDNGDNDGLGQR